ncbi:MAG: hypothetical protein QW795_08425 [Candidatus Bathyarchaeia archaeon]
MPKASLTVAVTRISVCPSAGAVVGTATNSMVAGEPATRVITACPEIAPTEAVSVTEPARVPER